MSQAKPNFNLHLTYEEALASAKEYQASHKADNGKDLHIWEDPHNLYGERMKLRMDGFTSRSFDDDIKEIFEVGEIDKEARAAFLWLLDRHRGFNALELNQIIIGVQTAGFGEDKAVALFSYLSREDDCLRDFITEKASDLLYK